MSVANLPLGVMAFVIGGLFVLALHALKPRRAEVPIGSSMLWEPQEVGATAAVPWQKPPKSRLLYLQLGVVGVLAALLAQPTMQRISELEEHTVVIVDVSASMAAVDGEPNRLADAQVIAREFVEEFSEESRVSLISAGPTPRVHVSGTNSQDSYLAAIDSLRVSDGPANIAEAVALAGGLDRPEAPIGVVLISDGAHPELSLDFLPDGFTHRIVGRSEVNHALTDLVVERTGVGLVVTAQAEVLGGGAADTTLRFDVDGTTQAVVDLSLQPGTPTTTEVTLPDGERVVARLGGDDLLAIDNTRYATARSQEDLLISVEGQSTPFVEALLSVVPGVTVIEEGDDARPAITIFSGGTVPADIDRPFLAIAPDGGAPGVAVTGIIEEPEVDFLQSADPLLTGLDLSGLRVVESQAIESAAGEVLLGSDSDPLLVRGNRGGIPFFYLAFALEDSTLPVEVAFPVLGQRILEELSGSVRVPVALSVGDQIVSPTSQPVVVTSPNGTERDRPAGSAPVVADRPGIWNLQLAGGLTQEIAVNLDRTESDVEPQSIAATTPRPFAPTESSGRVETPFPWPYLAALLVVGLWEWAESRRRKAIPRPQWLASTALRMTALVLVALSILNWTIDRPADDVATVFVLDRSDSVGTDGVTQGNSVVEAAVAAAPNGAQSGVVVVGEGAFVQEAIAPVGDGGGSASVEVSGARTNLAAGMRLAGTMLPDDVKRRVVVVSDGRATTGDAEIVAAELGEQGIAVDYVLLDPSVEIDAAVVDLAMPSSTEEGSRIDGQVTIDSTVSGPATVTVRRNDEIVDSVEVTLSEGLTSIVFTDAPGGTGLFEYSATIDVIDDQRPENNTARSRIDVDGEARILIIEGAEGTGTGLDAALTASGMVVDRVAATATPTVDVLVAYESVVLIDVASTQLSDEQIQALVVSTREVGTGLVTIGGPQSFGLGAYRNSELESVLPVLSEIPPEREERVAQVLALDTSESMGECHCAEGTEDPAVSGIFPSQSGVDKTAIARVGANQAIANLNANDQVGVLAVDTTARWILNFGDLPAQQVIDSGLARIAPSGDSDFSNTLPTAASALRSSDAELKHVIFFTDGFGGPGELEELEEQAAELFSDGITTSIVATGEGAVEDLRVIAEAGGGRFYAGRDLTRIPDLLVQESQLASRNFLQQGEFAPLVSDTTAVVDGLDETPLLTGYVVTNPKPTSRTSLRIGDDGDPLLASWQVGLGRSTAWTSDAGSRWASEWTTWDGYVDFWSRVVRDTFPVDDAGEVRATVEDGTMTIRAESAGGQRSLDALVSLPNGGQSTVALREIAPGVFEGTFGADAAGTYAVGVRGLGGGGTQVLGSAITSVSYSAEYRPGEPDQAALARLSELSGGNGPIEPREAFAGASLLNTDRPVALTPVFLTVAGIAFLGAIAMSMLRFGQASLGLRRGSRVRPARITAVPGAADIPL